MAVLLVGGLGALTDALLAAPKATALLDRGRLVDVRRRWFDRNGAPVLIAISLWPLAQIYPEPMLFGNGNLRATLEPVLTALGGRWWRFEPDLFGPGEFLLAEAFVVAAALLRFVIRRAAARYPVLVIRDLQLKQVKLQEEVEELQKRLHHLRYAGGLP